MFFGFKRIRSKYTTGLISFKNENTNEIFKKDLEQFSRYSIYPNIKNARKLLCTSLDVCSNNLILGGGSEELLKNLFLILDYDSIQILEHSFELGFYYNRLLNKKIITNHFSFDGQSFAYDDIEKLGGEVLYLVSPHCPTGIEFTVDQIISYSRKFKYVIVDEAYLNPTSFDKPIIHNVIYIRSFSKLGGVPGLRIGYAIAHKDIIDKLNCIRNSYEICTHAIDYLQYIFNNKQLINHNINEYVKCYNLLKNEINTFSVHRANFAIFQCTEKLIGKRYKIDNRDFVRVTLCDSLNYENLYCR
jgi:histidinol-phosphate aminotransferase